MYKNKGPAFFERMHLCLLFSLQRFSDHLSCLWKHNEPLFSPSLLFFMSGLMSEF